MLDFGSDIRAKSLSMLEKSNDEPPEAYNAAAARSAGTGPRHNGNRRSRPRLGDGMRRGRGWPESRTEVGEETWAVPEAALEASDYPRFGLRPRRAPRIFGTRRNSGVREARPGPSEISPDMRDRPNPGYRVHVVRCAVNPVRHACPGHSVTCRRPEPILSPPRSPCGGCSPNCGTVRSRYETGP